MGLADSFNLCGALEFSEKLSKVGTQPIIGTQLNLKAFDNLGKITLYAKTETGYKNLTKLSSLSYLKTNKLEEPTCEINDLINNSKDLILLSGNQRDFFGKLFESNKLKTGKRSIESLKKTLRKEFILRYKDIKKREKKILRVISLNKSKKN